MSVRSIFLQVAVVAAASCVFVPGTVLAGLNRHDDDKDEVQIRKVAASARTIDRLVMNRLGKHGVAPNPLTDDHTFLRRSYLSIVGRIPSLKEMERFLKSRKSDKRRQLIDELLASPGYTSHMFNFWADLLRIKSGLPGGVSGEPYIHWVKDSISRNDKYDEFVSNLLTAEGAAYVRSNGATGYYLRDRNMPEDNMANTVRIFLGTRLECAQCHNHPFDKWTQKDFYQMAAFTGGIRFSHELSATVEGKRLATMAKSIEKKQGKKARYEFDRMLRPMTAGIRGKGNGKTRLPRDYQYDDGKPRDVVEAGAIFEFSDAVGQETDAAGPKKTEKPTGSRSVYAKWLTSRDNPRFTTVIANRMWKRIMGVGLIEPVDVLMDSTKPSNPELMSYLEALMREVDYDLVAFQRVLYNTAVFQRASSLDVSAKDHTPLFPGPRLRRMTAEQIWDSMLTLVVAQVDGTTNGAPERAEGVYRNYENLSALEENDVSQQVGMTVMREMDRKMYDNIMRKQEQEVAKKRRIKARENKPLLRELKKARERGNEKSEMRLIERLERKGVTPPPRASATKERNLLRASELSSPAAAGHALRQFGQSDRDQIEAATAEANIPQVLMLLNGFIEDAILGREDSAIMNSLSNKRSGYDRIQTAYLAILGRESTTEEMDLWRGDMKRHNRTIWRDLIWSLLNTHEFMFVR